MSHHERASSDEKFVGNTSDGAATIERLHAQGVSSARLGSIAYNINGTKIPESWGYRPVFIKFTDEMNYDRAMTKSRSA